MRPRAPKTSKPGVAASISTQFREAIRACYDASENGMDFDAALAREGLMLAQGEKRDFIVIDHAGGIHALGKRILGESAAQIRQRLSDLDRDELPTAEQARTYLNPPLQPEIDRAAPRTGSTETGT